MLPSLSCSNLKGFFPEPLLLIFSFLKLLLSKFFNWDLVIAHPECKYLCASGYHWTVRGLRDPKLSEDALEFFRFFLELENISHIAVENPVGIVSKRICPPDQYIQPYEFGENASKKTGLWLKNLPKLIPTEYFPPRIVNGKKRWGNQCDSGQNNLGPSEKRSQARSKTYDGIAKAMAEQWSHHIISKSHKQETLFSYCHVVHNTNTNSKDI